MNFAEQLSYWYLRLNGFFPLTNFVLHHSADNRTSDADLLAVRFPYVSEEVGGQPNDWDERFQDKWGIDLPRQQIGMIVEVKSGRWSHRDLVGAAHTRRVRDGLRRLGMIPPDQIDDAVEELSQSSTTEVGGCLSTFLLIGDGNSPDTATWLHLQLDEVDDFVRRRMRTYWERKLADRNFFSSDLIQYLAWKAGRAGWAER